MLWIANVGTSLMLGRFWTSMFNSMLVDPSSDEAIFAIKFTAVFWPLGIYTNSNLSNSWARCFVSLRYFYILSSFASYSSLIYLITNFESLWMSKFLTPSAFPSLSPISIPSYSASLLVAIFQDLASVAEKRIGKWCLRNCHCPQGSS